MSELRDTRLEKAKTLESIGQGPYALGFAPSHRMEALQSQHADLPNGEERDVTVSVAGRVMTRRVMGKLAFFTLCQVALVIWIFQYIKRACRPAPADGPAHQPGDIGGT